MYVSIITDLGEEYVPLQHRAKEMFTIEDDHKCYVTRTQTMQLYLLFGPDVPNYALRCVSVRVSFFYSVELKSPKL